MFKRIYSKFQNNTIVFQLSIFTISAVLFFLLFLPSNNPLLKYISVIVRYNNLRFLPILAITLLLALTIKNIRISALLTALIVFPICALALVGLWASMYTEKNVIAGILPRIDALSFFTSSMALIEKGYLIGFTQRRPLFGGFFAVIMWLFNRNLQAALILFAFLCAIVLFLALIEVRRILNPISAVVFFIPQFLYYRMYIGNIMSETLGFFLGMASFLLFIRALNLYETITKKSIILFSVATFLFTLSQLARPGAILTIPIFILFAGWLYKKNKLNFKVVAIVIITIIIAILINRILFHILTLNNSSQYNNAGYGLYGVVSGGNGWSQILVDHPEISTLPSGIREKRITEIIFWEFINHPGNFIKGMQVQFMYIFSLFPTYYYNIYSFMLSSNYQLDRILIGIYYLFSLLGVANIIQNRSNPLSAFIAALLLGFFISLPISPAYQSQFMRYYPATTPLLGILPAIGIDWVTSKIIKKKGLIIQTRSEIPQQIFDYGIMLSVIAMLAGPIFLAQFRSEKNHTQLSCLPNETQVIFPYYERSEVRVMDITKTWIPYISGENFRQGALNIPNIATKEYFRNIKTPANIFPSINFQTHAMLYVFVQENQIPHKSALLTSCGTFEDVYGNSSDSGFYFPRIIEIE